PPDWPTGGRANNALPPGPPGPTHSEPSARVGEPNPEEPGPARDAERGLLVADEGSHRPVLGEPPVEPAAREPAGALVVHEASLVLAIDGAAPEIGDERPPAVVVPPGDAKARPTAPDRDRVFLEAEDGVTAGSAPFHVEGEEQGAEAEQVPARAQESA